MSIIDFAYSMTAPVEAIVFFMMFDAFCEKRRIFAFWQYIVGVLILAGMISIVNSYLLFRLSNAIGMIVSAFLFRCFIITHLLLKEYLFRCLYGRSWEPLKHWF